MGVVGDVPSIIAGTMLLVSIVASVGGGADRETLVVGTESSIRSIPDLAGKRVGIVRGSIGHGFWYRVAKRDGLDLTSVRLVDLQPPEMIEALGTGQIDAAAVWEPWPIAEHRGIGRAIARGSRTGNDYPLQLLITNRCADEHPEAVVALLRALQRGADYARNQPDETSKFIGRATGLPVEVVRRSMDFHFFEVKWSGALERSLRETAAFLLEIGTLRVDPDWEAMIKPTLWRS